MKDNFRYNGFHIYGGHDDLKMLLTNINRLTFIINCKINPNIINTKSSIISILYFRKTIFKDYYFLYKYFNILEINR